MYKKKRGRMIVIKDVRDNIIETHGGTVGVKNEEGKGTNFYFTLPV